MTRDQTIVAIGAASGVAAMALAMWLLSTRVLPAPAGVESVGDRLGYALRWVALAALLAPPASPRPSSQPRPAARRALARLCLRVRARR